MPVNENYLAAFEYESIYHIYNKTNNKELLFRSDENFLYFLFLYAKYISPFADTFAWNLLPNHFHLMVRIKKENEVEKYIINLPLDIQTKTEKLYLINKDINTLIENEFKRFLLLMQWHLITCISEGEIYFTGLSKGLMLQKTVNLPIL